MKVVGDPMCKEGRDQLENSSGMKTCYKQIFKVTVQQENIASLRKDSGKSKQGKR